MASKVKDAYNKGVRKGVRALAEKLASEYGADADAVEKDILAKMTESEEAESEDNDKDED